jgi:hypothetical protein
MVKNKNTKPIQTVNTSRKFWHRTCDSASANNARYTKSIPDKQASNAGNNKRRQTHKQEEKKTMLKRFLSISLLLAVIAAFTIPAFAEEIPAAAPAPEKQVAAEKSIVKGTIGALDTKEKKITIDGTVYTLGRRAAKADVKVGDVVEATVKDGKVKSIAKAPATAKE